MDIFKKGGFNLKTDNFHVIIDPTGIRAANEADLILISHAHTDHIKSIEKMHPLKILSQPTLDVILARNKNAKNLKNYQIIDSADPNNNTIEIDEKIKITAHPAGHCIGSLQFLIELEKEKILYTGDFCLDKRLRFETGNIHEVENGILVIDPTYSKKEYVFPERKILYKQIFNWMKRTLSKKNNIFLIGRQLGTCQELTSIINYSTFKKCRVYTHPSVFRINEVHSSYSSLGKFEYKKNPLELKEEQGINDLERFFSESEEKSKPNGKKKCIYLLPFYYMFQNRMNELADVFGRQTIAVFTGWALTRKFSVTSFPLTSHAGFNHIQEYYKKSKARQMYFF